VHDAPGAMRVSLFVLAVATLTTWLLVGPFGDLLNHTLSFQTLGSSSTAAIVLHVLSAWPTWLALAVVALGLAAWWWRDRLAPVSSRLHFLSGAATADFGFAWLNRVLVRGTRGIAEGLSVTQTGQLNLNVLGIVGGLAIVLAILAWGV
jgi:NADH:ubiquinone oxidoreductase subunit 5 (subunit L)/multisubunit Na+/H+ antiporter MnhA subunit